MPGTIMDALATLMGRPDPSMRLMAALGQGPGQAGSNAGPLPPAVAGATGQAGGGAPPTQQGAPPAAQGAQGGQGGPSQPTMGNGQPAPNAYASPSDMGQMYLAMAQRAQASRGFNSGLAMIAAGLYPGRTPGGAAGLANAMNAGVQDPGELFGNLMRLQTFGQQAQALQAFYRAVPDIAKQLNLTPDEVLAAGPDAVHTALQANLPPEAMRNWTYAKRQYVAEHANDPGPDGKTPIGADAAGKAFEQQFPMSTAIVGAIPGMDPTTRDRTIELAQWQADPANKGKPPPAYFNSNADYLAHTKQAGEETSDFVEARGKFPSLIATAQQYEGDLDKLGNAPNLGNIIGKNISVPDNPAAAKLAGFTQEDYDLDQVRKRLYGEDYAKSFSEGQGRRSTQEVAGLQSGRSNFQSTGMSVAEYQDQAIVRQRINNYKLMANAYLASGNGAQMPGYLRPYGDPQYNQGSWAARNGAPPTPQPNGKPLSAQQLAEGRKMAERVGAPKLIATLKAGGWDTSQFE
jgi:hypothetical protein